MSLCSIIYNNDNENIIQHLNNIKKYFEEKNCGIRISERVENKTHFIKIYCINNKFDDKMKVKLQYYLSELIYKITVEYYFKNELQDFLCNTYFFLKYNELEIIKDKVTEALSCNSIIQDENSIYFLNRKNNVIERIKYCLEENDEINIDGYIRFRMKENREDIENVVDKVVELYMVEKEYEEFIKLLKYFVEVQDSKIELVNIIIDTDGNFDLKDRNGDSIMMEIVGDVVDSKITGYVNIEDIIISGLITTSPEEIMIFGEENCKNKEFINTIKSVFLSRVKICDDYIYQK